MSARQTFTYWSELFIQGCPRAVSAEMENHPRCIKNMDVIAWVPGIPGHGPKFPVPDNSQPGTLCLKYKGMKIFIPCKSTKLQSDSNVVKDDKEKKIIPMINLKAVGHLLKPDIN
ncbi:uncharacterized protein LOC112684756 [Sipha flava]|uniref:Uncharacterized protein LOC112684756 n=1 Tax=Sipha flava TaxID=143950 RepID=A0A8B8FPC3_9HEMI|nr:uncharacterized protein LOC112684756 [Sipha flava]